MANRRLQCRQLFWRNGWSTASERAGCAPTGQPARTVAQQRRPARSVGARGGHEGPASTRALTPRLSPLQRYPNPPSLASADVTLRPVRAGTRDDDTPAVAGHERRLRRDPPLRGSSSRDSHAAVSRRLQGRVCCHSPEGRPPRPLTRFAGPVRSARARARGMSPPAASSARCAHSQSPAQALTRRRSASSVAQRCARSSTAT